MADNEMNNQVNTVNTDPLRNANPLPESDTESEVEQEQEQEEVHQEENHVVPHLEVARHYSRNAAQYLQTFGFQTFLFLQLVWTLLSRAASTTQSVSQGVVRSLQTQLYVFFKDSTYPYRAQNTVLAGPGIAPIEWYYNADTKVFLSSTLYNSTNEYETHHFEWLSGEVKYNDLTLYDITEFLQQVRWGGATRPTPAHVLSAWSLHSGIVLNLREGLILKTINEDGSESSLNVRG